MTGGAMRHNGAHEIATPALPLTIRQATPADVDEVTRIYIDSWNAGFGELLSQADRMVTAELLERWGQDLARPDTAPMVGCRAYGFDRRGSRHRPQPGPGRLRKSANSIPSPLIHHTGELESEGH